MNEIEMSLKECAEEIRKREIRLLEDCFEIGKQLLKARDVLRHQGPSMDGQWLTWLEKEVQFSDDQARNFIRVYEKYGTGEMKLRLASEFCSAKFSSLASMAAPSADPEAVKEVEKELMEGKELSTREVKKRIRATAHSKADKNEKRREKGKSDKQAEFAPKLLAAIRRKRKEANDVRITRRWRPEAVDKIMLHDLLDAVENFLDEFINHRKLSFDIIEAVKRGYLSAERHDDVKKNECGIGEFDA